MSLTITTEEITKAFGGDKPMSEAGIFVFPPRLIEGRDDCCIIRRQTGLHNNTESDHLYLVWKDGRGEIQGYQFAWSSRDEPDYIDVDSAAARGDEITITYSSGGSVSGKGPWQKTYTRNIATSATVYS